MKVVAVLTHKDIVTKILGEETSEITYYTGDDKAKAISAIATILADDESDFYEITGVKVDM